MLSAWYGRLLLVVQLVVSFPWNQCAFHLELVTRSGFWCLVASPWPTQKRLTQMANAEPGPNQGSGLERGTLLTVSWSVGRMCNRYVGWSWLDAKKGNCCGPLYKIRLRSLS